MSKTKTAILGAALIWSSATVQVMAANLSGEAPYVYQVGIAAQTTDSRGLVFTTDDPKATVTAKGLPRGLAVKKLGKGEFAIAGNTTAKGGDYPVVITTRIGRTSEVQPITIRVLDLPQAIVGTFTGVVYNQEEQVIGTATVTVTSAGKVSAKVATVYGTNSYSIPKWSSLKAGTAAVTYTDRKKSLELKADYSASAGQIVGTGSFVTTYGDSVGFTFAAEPNLCDAKTGTPEAQAVAVRQAGVYTFGGEFVNGRAPKGDYVKATVRKDGKVTVAGKKDGKAISHTATLIVEGDAAYVHSADVKAKRAVEVSLDLQTGDCALNAFGYDAKAKFDATMLTPAQALEKALAATGFTRAEIRDLEIERERKYGVTYYEVEFDAGHYEYECYVNAATGEVFGSVDQYKPGKPGKPTGGAGISGAEAADIALKHAGFSRSQVRELEVEIETLNGRQVYEVEFKKGAYEYDYYVDCADGSVIRRHVELD